MYTLEQKSIMYIKVFCSLFVSRNQLYILICFAACPAYVSLEISHDSVTHTPQCQPLMTSSLAFIKLQLQRPQIATTVTIRLHKARDSMTIGLSQVMLMGYSAFGYTGSSTQNILLPTVDFISQSR
jgi:baculoviral IAP repeat-containing protein 6